MNVNYRPRRGFLLDKCNSPKRLTPKSRFLVELEEEQDRERQQVVLTWAASQRIDRTLKRIK